MLVLSTALVLGLIFFAVFWFFYSLALFRGTREPSPVEQRLEEIRQGRVTLQTAALLEEKAADQEGRASRGLLGQVRVWLSRAEKRSARRGQHQRVELRLRQAGLRLRASEYLVLRGMLGALIGFLAMLAGSSPLLFPIAAVLGFWLPEVYVERICRKRLKRFTEQLPEALTVIANSLRSGYSFMQAMAVAAEELADPIAAEFRQVVRETQVDISLEDALNNLAGRVPSADLKLLVTAVLIQRQVGGNLAGLLDQVGETIRQRLQFAREVTALTAQGRMSGWVVGGLPVALGFFIYVTNPAYIGLLFTDPMGKGILLVAAVSELIGALVIRRMIQVEM